MQKVATVFVSHDQGMRRAGEDQMARELTAKGVQAVPAYAVLGDADMRDLDTVKSTLAAQGYDGVVTMRTVDKEQQLEYAPETFDDYWGVAASGFFEPGYAYTETLVRMETNAYSLRDNQLVWSALTRTVDPASSRQLVDDTSKVVASQLTERGLAG